MNAGPYEHHKIEQIRQLIIQIGKKEHIPVLDLTTLSMKDGLSFDGVHPNVNGQKKIAEAIINYLNAHPIQ
ncbi:SGNH/GDSL hydrolase family protein [uncultured Dubosiella sp.]|nr:SGNH/GDSL hydrolase family protein [uncultured Dubosiella sp.]